MKYLFLKSVCLIEGLFYIKLFMFIVVDIIIFMNGVVWVLVIFNVFKLYRNFYVVFYYLLL